MIAITFFVGSLVGAAVMLVIVALCQSPQNNPPRPDYSRFHAKFRKWQNN